YVWTASTLGGNPVSCAAALAALEIYRRPGTYERLHALGARLRAGMAATLERQGQRGQVIGDGPLGQVVFSDRPVTDYRSTKAGDAATGRALMLGLFERGIWLNPMGTKLYLSIAHDEAAVDEFLGRFEEALVGLA
ncbi:MAG: aminotransferase class III-fold pyridoxal phosphate-dependent enzyme, partial [Kiloniellales bacterium]|nr:aminotransferase class III-fold pyridoxal phosphate-dependent enzyme [Kiloniellales bacterium]